MSFAHRQIHDFLDALAAKQPAPGGGAVAPIVCALAAALGEMVLNYSVGKKKFAEFDKQHRAVLTDLAAMRGRLLELADDDAKAYAALNALWKLDENDPRRMAEWDKTVAAAIEVPSQVLKETVALLEHLQALTSTTNRMLRSDLAMAGILAEAAARCAGWNIHINLPVQSDQSLRAQQEEDVRGQLDKAAALAETIAQACRE